MTDDPPHDPQDVAPRIELRVPGPWTGPEDLNACLQRAGAGYELADEVFVQTNGPGAGRRFEWGVTPPDGEIADVFAGTGRLTDDEVAAIRGHACKVHVIGPGGSADTARAMMGAATALIRAGGTGVLIDSSLASHSPGDWLDLAADDGPGGVYWAYLSMAGRGGRGGEVYSCGMHCLGLRDAELPDPPDDMDVQAAGFLLHNFLGYTYLSGATVLDGDPLGDEETGPTFRVRHRLCTRFAEGSPSYNPYGVWRLERMEPE